VRTPPTEERQVVWEVLAQFWVDTWYAAEELDQFADRLARCGFSIRELDRIRTPGGASLLVAGRWRRRFCATIVDAQAAARSSEGAASRTGLPLRGKGQCSISN
jgi:hypothetical protein